MPGIASHETVAMNRPFARLAACVALLSCLATAAAADPPPPPPDDSPQPKMAPLLAYALKQLAGMAGMQLLGDSPWGLFRRLLGRQPEAARADPVRPAGAAPAALAPVVGYTVQQLDPASFEVLKALPVQGGPPVMRTGEVFALLYSTNLPGQVRLENIDPAGVVADLGVYTVLPDQLNRIPRDLGIKLVGQPGQELIRFYFYPCLPAGTAGAAWAAATDRRTSLGALRLHALRRHEFRRRHPLR